MNAISFSQLGKIHQYATVSVGETSRVYYLKIPGSCVGFLNQISSNYYTGVKWHVYVDGECVERDVEVQLGIMGDPRRIDPPYLVNNYVEVKVYNGTDEDLLLEVFGSGEVYHKSSTLALMKND